MAGDARFSALTALERCRRNGAFSQDALSRVIVADGLDSRDAALCAQLCLGVLQNATLCDFYIAAYSAARPEKLQPKVLDILRLSVYQILFLDRVPDRAAVSEAVSLCKRCGCARAAGLVNAVLRRISENKDALPAIPGEGSAAYLSVKYSHPLWLAEALTAEQGYDFAEALFAANNSPAPITVQRNPLRATMEKLTASLESDGVACQVHPWLPDCLVLVGAGNLTRLSAFREGLFYVQDPAARLAVTAAMLRPGMAVLDACAAPGGKSFAACVDLAGEGSVLACDLKEKKLERIESGARRLGFQDMISTAAMDARSPYGPLLGRFDAVLADVPCSGLGVIRKKPEIRNKRPEELEALPAIQMAIVEGLAPCVKPGGVLLYSTCTVLKRENEAVIEAFLKKHPEFAPEPFTIPGRDGAFTGAIRSFWPHLDGTDGFFLCRLKKAN